MGSTRHRHRFDTRHLEQQSPEPGRRKRRQGDVLYRTRGSGAFQAPAFIGPMALDGRVLSAGSGTIYRVIHAPSQGSYGQAPLERPPGLVWVCTRFPPGAQGSGPRAFTFSELFAVRQLARRAKTAARSFCCRPGLRPTAHAGWAVGPTLPTDSGARAAKAMTPRQH